MVIGSTTQKNCMRFQIFDIFPKDFMVRFQDLRAKKLQDIQIKTLSIRRSTETLVSKDFRK